MLEGKHRMVLRMLRSRVLRGTYEGRMPGERQLAKELGVAVSTIELALTQLEAVGLVQRKLRAGTFVVPKEEREKTYAPMTVVLSALPESAATVTGGFGQAVQAHGLEMVLLMHSGKDLDKGVEDVLLRLRNMTCVGACFFDFPMDSAHALRLAAASGPVVLADWQTPDLILPTITYDDHEAGRMAAAHLLKLGHRRILLVDPLAPDPARIARRNGVAELVQQSGGVYRERIAPNFTWGEPPCVAALQEDRPTAVISSEFGAAISMARAATSLGLRIPHDLSIVCIGNTSARDANEDFTFVRFDEPALGAAALELVLESAPSEEPRRRFVPVHFRDKGSTAPPPT